MLREEDVLILLMGEMQMRWRKQVENAPLKPNTRLKTALTKLPSHWLEAIGRQGDLGEVRNRKDRIDVLTEWLPQEENLRKIWNSLPLPSREVVHWILLERNGAVKIQNLSRRYGADTDITWWWNEGQMPETPLGLLRSKGLVYVGKIREGKRRFRIAVVPVELRKALTRIAQDPRSMEGDPSPGKSLWREPSEESFIQEDLLEAPISESTDADPWKGLDSFNLRSFLSVCPLREDTEGMYAQTLGRIRRNPEDFPRAASPFVPHPYDPGELGVEPAGGVQARARPPGRALRRVRPYGQLPPDPAVGRERSRAPPGKALLAGSPPSFPLPPSRGQAPSGIPGHPSMLTISSYFIII